MGIDSQLSILYSHGKEQKFSILNCQGKTSYTTLSGSVERRKVRFHVLMKNRDCLNIENQSSKSEVEEKMIKKKVSGKSQHLF